MSLRERDIRLSIDYGANDEFRRGGIDPRTGYYRRSLYSYTGYQFTSPIPLNDVIKILTNPKRAYEEAGPIKEHFGVNHASMPPEQVFLIAFMSISFIFLIYVCITKGCVSSKYTK